MEVLCPHCHLPVLIPPIILVNRQCRHCERQFKVEYLESDDHWDWLCPTCLDRMEQENQEFVAAKLIILPEDQLPGI
jgi:hypothetical protein